MSICRISPAGLKTETKRSPSAMREDSTTPKDTGFFRNLSAYVHQIKCASPLYDMALRRVASVRNAPLIIPPDPWPGDAARGYDALQGVYSYEGRHLRSLDVIWEPEGVHDAWLTAMHGFDVLRDLRALGGERARRHARYLIGDWLEHYGRWHPLSWRPDIAARRIVHWLSSYMAFCASAEEEFCNEVLTSLARQLKHVSGHSAAEDLLYTAKALFYGGMAVGEEKYCRQALHLLAAEIRGSILSDGGHKSRNPEHHLIFLQNLLDLRAALHLAGLKPPEFLPHTVAKMSSVLRSLRHNDGGLAVFHGGSAMRGSLCDMVLAQAGQGQAARPLKSLGATGYERLSQGRTTVIMDVGETQEGGHHAGLLAFEMSCGRDRLIVNCGTWNGHPAWNKALRSTAAHSTVTVEESNALPQRSEKTPLIRKPEIKKLREDINGTAFIDAVHDGYQERFGVVHRRVLTLKESGNILEGKDILSGMDGAAFTLRFHLHPSVRASVIRGGTQILLRTQSGQGWYFSCNSSVFGLEESVYVMHRHCDAPHNTVQIFVHAQIAEGKTSVKWSFSKAV
ncbi:MAG: hypothetical protein EA357_09655 [Micavibrio sp.]|nr:MAG: hypothetical protein EA357_09655 [Micavibrio sp.]